ncbi:T9SS type A sorting domain-containing protein [candidate division WOR-3 bacterium]|nr:T9SS type A sorting domain-containing protein [candidate division WOR-3 bacterium]
MPSSSYIQLAIFDAAGLRVEVLDQGYTPSGVSETIWDASKTSSGVYFVRLLAADETRTARILVIK